MRIRVPLLVAISLAGIVVLPTAEAEDMQLRARAVQLLDAAQAANVIRGGSWIIHTEASFQATSDDGTLQSGIYTRTRLPDGSLRQDVRFGDWKATNLFVDRQVSSVGEWNYPPFAVRRLFTLVPFAVGSFEREDVVRAIREGSAAGIPATCVDYDTIHGERRSSNEICLGKADGTLLSIHEEDRTYEYSRYTHITGVGSLYPQHLEFREGNRFSISIDLTMTKLEVAPANAFTVPTGAVTGTFCKTFSQPVPLHSPQPAAQGGPDAAVTNVAIQLYIANDGTVVSPQVIHPDRADLDAEALKVVHTWTFTPPTCNGQPNTVPATVVLHFQGR